MTNAVTGEVTELVINEKLDIGDTFRLIGTRWFSALSLPMVVGFIPAVTGISLCGNVQNVVAYR